ncbi:hypothetical protein BD779DRAFT_1790454 [Infundibulicybe gibba]|nr:hypothetical protein BD779DRAFT_1790454 [Infundibulicybe gibba]
MLHFPFSRCNAPAHSLLSHIQEAIITLQNPPAFLKMAPSDLRALDRGDHNHVGEIVPVSLEWNLKVGCSILRISFLRTSQLAPSMHVPYLQIRAYDAWRLAAQGNVTSSQHIVTGKPDGQPLTSYTPIFLDWGSWHFYIPSWEWRLARHRPELICESALLACVTLTRRPAMIRLVCQLLARDRFAGVGYGCCSGATGNVIDSNFQVSRGGDPDNKNAYVLSTLRHQHQGVAWHISLASGSLATHATFVRPEIAGISGGVALVHMPVGHWGSGDSSPHMRPGAWPSQRHAIGLHCACCSVLLVADPAEYADSTDRLDQEGRGESSDSGDSNELENRRVTSEVQYAQGMGYLHG